MSWCTPYYVEAHPLKITNHQPLYAHNYTLPPPLAYIPTGTAPGKPAFSRQLHNPLLAVLVSASFGLFAINFALLGITPVDVLSCL